MDECTDRHSIVENTKGPFVTDNNGASIVASLRVKSFYLLNILNVIFYSMCLQYCMYMHKVWQLYFKWDFTCYEVFLLCTKVKIIPNNA